MATDDGLALVEDRTALDQSMRQLTEQNRDLLRLYFTDGMTQSEIAGRLRCSQMQVSRLLAQVIRRLRQDVVGV